MRDGENGFGGESGNETSENLLDPLKFQDMLAVATREAGRQSQGLDLLAYQDLLKLSDEDLIEEVNKSSLPMWQQKPGYYLALGELLKIKKLAR